MNITGNITQEFDFEEGKEGIFSAINNFGGGTLSFEWQVSESLWKKFMSPELVEDFTEDIAFKFVKPVTGFNKVRIVFSGATSPNLEVNIGLIC